MTIPANSEKIFTIVLNWSVGPEKRKRDWSVTAWGLDHELIVEHVDGIESDHFPLHDD